MRACASSRMLPVQGKAEPSVGLWSANVFLWDHQISPILFKREFIVIGASGRLLRYDPLI